ncbi:MAG: family 78 glycoside hydrolase catalytic domain, partial [Candidatus Hydrogenedentes bacterium]|nr:family 78 glycoside hydrolase catalytic domain [Candidatus Hydrogenedentota bacterium]
SGPAGTKITLKYRELLKDDGTLDHRNAVYVFSGDFQTDTYILKGEETEVWSPRFVYHGYRYVQVEGLPNPPTEDTLRAQVVHTDFETAGEFECSNTLLNRIQQNARWSYVGNYMGYPTDCPHREKNGWTGDAHLAAEMGLMNFHTGAAYTKWLDDFADEQNEAGEYAAIIPTCGWGYGIGPSWDCAYVLIPWHVYQYCGDTRILETHYDNLKRYVDFLGTKADNYMVDYGLGDWCPPLGGSGSHKSPRMLTSTAYYYKDAELLARMANVLGKPEDAAKYSALADNIKQAFNERLYDAETGLYAGDTQTSQACALYQGLATDRDKVFGQLLTQIEAADGHLDCGILGTKYLMRVLSDFGRTDVAYGIAAKTTFPSWGHWIEQGATTLWERWDGGESHYHIMFGDVSAWFYAALAGIAPDAEAPGFKRIIMHPRPVPGLTWARAWHDSPYGRIASHWQWENGQYRHEIEVPVNASALVYVPDTGAVTEHRRPVAEAEGVEEQAGIEGYRVFEVASGSYVFEVPLPSQSDLLRY